MKCNNCKAEWNVPAAMSASIKTCPFCGADLAPKPDGEINTLQDVLKAIIAHGGLNSLRNGGRSLAMFSDLAPKLRKERTLYSYLVQCEGNSILLDVLNKSRPEQLAVRGKLMQRMVDDLLLSEAVARQACDSFWEAISGSSLNVVPLAEKKECTPIKKSDSHENTSAIDMPSTSLTIKPNTSDQMSVEESILLNWDSIDYYVDNKITVIGEVTECNQGGLVAVVQGIRVFIPASQSCIAKGPEMSNMIGQTVQMKIMEVNHERRRAIGSIRAVVKEARESAKEKIWAEINIGKKYHGVVKSITSYGAFVDIGGVEGLVHISDLSWHPISTPTDVIQVDDEIDVYVVSFDAEKGRISLGYKTAEMNPWHQFMKNYKVGDIVDAKIVKIMTFGAFAEVLPGVDGLIHVAHMSTRRNSKPSDIVTEGQIVQVKILEIDAATKRISLSMTDCK